MGRRRRAARRGLRPLVTRGRQRRMRQLARPAGPGADADPADAAGRSGRGPEPCRRGISASATAARRSSGRSCPARRSTWWRTTSSCPGRRAGRGRGRTSRWQAGSTSRACSDRCRRRLPRGSVGSTGVRCGRATGSRPLRQRRGPGTRRRTDVPPIVDDASTRSSRPILVLPGPLPDRPGEAIRRAFLASPWRVGTASDRMGLRLEGPSIAPADTTDIPSHGVTWGTIQLPPDGRPIVLLADHQPTGGYPVVAVVIAAERPRLGQLRPGADDPVRGDDTRRGGRGDAGRAGAARRARRRRRRRSALGRSGRLGRGLSDCGR